jgi:RES domain-containing protein
MPDSALCSDCFRDAGLRLDAEQIGIVDQSPCPNCGSSAGKKMDADRVAMLAQRFFVWGTLQRCEFGAAPLVVFNQQQSTNIKASPWLKPDICLIERTLGVGLFYYGPRLWMVGEVEPLKELQDPASREDVTSRILQQYPTRILNAGESFYRIRIEPRFPQDLAQYDSPPVELAGSGRFDSPDFPIMYASQDLPVCVHECRVAAEDELYVATLSATRNLKLLDLSVVLEEEGVSEFESLDMAIHMLFLAGEHAYEITRDIAVAAASAGYHGLVYPSYFSLLRTGGRPFETAYGVSQRRLPHLREHEKQKMIENLALFGRPIIDGRVAVRCLNKLVVSRVEYGFHFGPVGCDPDPLSSF